MFDITIQSNMLSILGRLDLPSFESQCSVPVRSDQADGGQLAPAPPPRRRP